MERNSFNEFAITCKVFLWKLAKEKQFYWKKNLCFSLLPIILVLLPLTLIDKLDLQEETIGHNEIFDPETERELYDINLSNEVIYFTPRNHLTEVIMDGMRLKLSLKDEDVRGLENDFQLQPILDDEDNNRFIIVKFHFGANATQWPSKIDYTLRVRHNGLQTHTQYLKAVQDSYFKPGNYPYTDFPYRDSGFLAVKLAIDRTIVQKLQQDVTMDFEIALIKFPQAAKQRPAETHFDAAALPLAMMIAALYLYLIILPSIETKSTGFDEHLKNASRFSYLNGVVIYAVNLAQILLIVIAMFVVFAVYDLFGCIDIGYPLFFAVLFVTAMMSFTFLLRAAFESVLTATICVPVIFLLPVALFGRISQPGVKCLEIYFPINAFLLGIDLFQDYLNTEHCFGVNDIFRETHPNGPYTYFHLCLALIIASVVYLLLAWFVTSFFPGKYGTPVNLAELFGRNAEEKVGPDVEACRMTDGRNRRLEAVADGQTPVVRIKNLCKVFKSLMRPPNTVVRDLSLDIYKNQITVLLGHNGAGKTTTMCMLTGMVSRSSGTIFVDGNPSVRSYRSLIGFCPQHNSFIPYLTCMEHLLFFGQLRGLSAAETRKQAKQIVDEINLTDKADMAAHTLSGGMQRRLSLANAIIGETKLLVLDEPSSGLDPESRRELWDVLLRLKKTNSILVTTHYMEEADVLGDKIAIMENGEVIAYGTSMFLKREYGNGYTLKLLKADVKTFRSGAVLDLIRDTIPGAKIKESVDSLMCVVLPYESQEDYIRVLDELEARQQEFGILSIGITNTTLEEVFLNSAVTDKKILSDREETDSSNNLITADCLVQQPRSKALMWQQLLAIQYKNTVYWKRNWISLVSMYLIVTVALLGIFNFNSGSSKAELATTNVSMEKLLDPQVLLVARPSRDSPEMERLMNLFKHNVQRDHGRFIELYNTNMNEVLLNISRTDKFRYNENLVAAFEVSLKESKQISIEVFYTRNIIHSVSIALNLAMNVMVQYTSQGNYTIDVINAPVSRLDLFSSKFLTIFMFANLIPFVFVCVMFIFIRLPYNEFWTKSKQIQNVSMYVYWLGNCLTDVVLFFVLCLYVLLLSRLLDAHELFAASEYAELLPVFFVFGCAYLLFIYVASQVFPTINGSITFFSYIHMLTIAANLILNIPGVRDNYAALVSLFYLFPDFALRQTLFAFADQKKFDNLLTGIPINYTKFYVSMLVTIVILGVVLLYVCENIYVRDRCNTSWHNLKTRLCSAPCKKATKQIDNDDVDGPSSSKCYKGDDEVDRERTLVKTLTANRQVQDEGNYSVVVHKLEKKYFDFPAVCGIDFAVQKGDCFGLLGMNGAGKTTTFNMMTLCETITDGSIEVNNVNCRKDKLEYKSQFGYCPQVDALNPLMTAYEILKYFAWIRGVPRHLLPNTVEYWLRRVDIDEFRDRQVQYFSGGTKRKLNTAVAMVGFPSLIFLDEPTTGVDPKSRRFVWGCIKEFQHQNKTVVLTSHSMDECEHLCNRLAIMAQGHFTCIGGIQQLKNKYGKGFTLTIKLKTIDGDNVGELERLKLRMAERFVSSLKDEHGGLLYYFIHDANIVWSKVFTKILLLKEEYANIFDDFSINEIGLEEIFLQFKRDIEPNVESTCV